VLRLRPDDVEALNNRGLAFDARGEYRRALVDYQAASFFQPDFVEVFNNRGAALEALEDDRGAMDAYLAAIRADPNFAVAYFNAARLFARLGCLDQCLTHLETAEKLEAGWMAEAAEDEQLSWVLELRQLRQRPSGDT
jgi:tetratricopeptide (TPR) repeat protein